MSNNNNNKKHANNNKDSALKAESLIKNTPITIRIQP